MGQKYLFELKRCASYGGWSNRELLMGIYYKIFTVPEESFELRRGWSNKKLSYRESTVLIDPFKLFWLYQRDLLENNSMISFPYYLGMLLLFYYSRMLLGYRPVRNSGA